jgi:hypothetical protein
LSAGGKSTRIISGYLPCRVPGYKEEAVYNQHLRYFRQLGDRRCPRTIFIDHIGQQIAEWKAAGEEVLLFIDANSNVYDGVLAQRLSMDDIRMTEQCKQVLGHESPNSHVDGSSPITGIFATSGVVSCNVFQSAHRYGLGDHRVFIIDIDLTSLIGDEFPQVVRLPGRKLQAKRYHLRKSYNNFVRRNIRRHRMIERYDSLRLNSQLLSTPAKQVAIDSLDNQTTELMLGGEKQCSKKCTGPLEFSPRVSTWIARLRLLRWIRTHKVTPLKDPRNLFRTCRAQERKLDIKQPRQYSLKEVEAQIVSTEKYIQDLKHVAPDFRLEHLYIPNDEKLKSEDWSGKPTPSLKSSPASECEAVTS